LASGTEAVGCATEPPKLCVHLSRYRKDILGSISIEVCVSQGLDVSVGHFVSLKEREVSPSSIPSGDVNTATSDLTSDHDKGASFLLSHMNVVEIDPRRNVPSQRDLEEPVAFISQPKEAQRSAANNQEVGVTIIVGVPSVKD
jgi:hypothetical protein